MATQRQVIFTSRKIPNNSFTMRGEQMCAALCERGYNAICETKNELHKYKDSIIVWVRRLSQNDKYLKTASANNNFQMLDVLDRLCFKDLCIDRINLVNAVLFASKYTYKIYGNSNRLNNHVKYWLWHHYDPILKSREYNQFQLGYWGYRTSALHVYNLISRRYRHTRAKSGLYPSPKWFDTVSCHYSVRDISKGQGWRPATKISTAAACGANIIITREPIAEELLPKDYPYFVDVPNIEETKRVIEHAKMTFNTDTWSYGLHCMNNVRKQTSVQRCAKLYGRIIDDINMRFFK